MNTVFRYLLCVLLCCCYLAATAQDPVIADTLKTDSARFGVVKKPVPAADVANHYDISDLARNIFHPGRPKTDKKSSGIIVVPNIAANPSIGAQLGIKAVAGRKLGNNPNTYLSVAASSASITTKGIIYFYISHNIYTSGNKWNFQGSLVAAKTVTPDHGLGIAAWPETGNGQDLILNNPGRTPRALNAQFYNFREKVYKEIKKNLFVGLGVSFDIRRKISERDTALTPYKIYNTRHGFETDHYMANGLLFNIQYTTRDNQNRAFQGMYADVGLRLNQRWMGSSRSALQANSDIRKYISLSRRTPEHVIALWNWGAYLINGNIPYPELPGTAKDMGARSGRGYMVQYFKGTQYNYSEVEYRFPILGNQFLSGVVFGHIQTANDEAGTRIFEKWQPGGGLGLRVLFNKVTRTNLCLDYGWGRFGARGFFLGLNEAF
jgi:hypothetical protein